MKKVNKKDNSSLIFAAITLGITLVLTLIISITSNSTSKKVDTLDAYDPNKVNIYFFHSQYCPHCIREQELLSEIEKDPKYAGIIIHRFEIARNVQNAQLFSKLGKELNIDVSGVPMTFIGEEIIQGYGDHETTGVEIKTLLDEALINKPRDMVTEALWPKQALEYERVRLGIPAEEKTEAKESVTSETTSVQEPEGKELDLPIFGKFKTSSVSLPALTAIIGIVDGFNPCAMWTLLFLITLLLGFKDRKKMWILGSTFILASGLVYFIFMAAWLNLFIFVGYSLVIRYGIGIFALGVAGYYVRDYIRNRNGNCEVVGTNEKRKETFEKIKAIIQRKNIFLAMGGMVILAFAVNLVELMCSAGLPAIYTNVLSMSNLPMWQYYAYMLGYIFFFMLDDLIVFSIAMVTLKTVGIEGKYTKYSHLIGAVIIGLLGLAMIFKPDLLMFN